MKLIMDLITICIALFASFGLAIDINKDISHRHSKQEVITESSEYDHVTNIKTANLSHKKHLVTASTEMQQESNQENNLNEFYTEKSDNQHDQSIPGYESGSDSVKLENSDIKDGGQFGDKHEDDEIIDYIARRIAERSKRAFGSYVTEEEDTSKEKAASELDDSDYADLMFEYLQDTDIMQDDFAPPPAKPNKGKMRLRPNDRINNQRNTRGRGKKASNEYKIKRVLLRDYDITSRPVMNDSTTVTVFVGMSLFHILDTNEKMQTLSALIAIRLRWEDEYLVWEPAQYGGVETVWIPAMQIWTPDIFINNFADESFQNFMNTYAIVQYTGEVLWMFPAVIKTYCTLDVRHFPFDSQRCDIVFISWTFNGFKVNITYNETEHSAIYYKPKNQEWFVDRVGAMRHEQIYACCVEPYPDVTFTIVMTRRSLFYVINLIFPCLLIYTVSFLGFFLPVESGEKVNLEITILLALVVFLLMVGETLPPTPDAIPALGLLFGTTMLMVSIALVMSVIVTNLFLRKDSGERVPYCIRKLFLHNSSASTARRLSASCRSRRFSSARVSNENHVIGGGENINTNNVRNNAYKNNGDIELDNISMYSEQETPFCASNHCRKRKFTLSYMTPELEQLNDLAWSVEWMMLAKCVDKIFFWLFLFSSVAALSSIFLSIPRHGNFK